MYVAIATRIKCRNYLLKYLLLEEEEREENSEFLLLILLFKLYVVK